MIIKIESGTTCLKTGTVRTNEDTDIYIPKSVRRIKQFAISGNLLKEWGANITIYYEGTIDEWNHILKGEIERVEIHNERSYSSHQWEPEYEEHYWYKPYFHTDLFKDPKVICSDGIVEKIVDEEVFREQWKINPDI